MWKWLPVHAVCALASFVSIANAAEISVGALTVPAQLKAGVRYKAILEFSNPDGAKITQACFLWSGEGPYCFKTSVGGDRASTWLVTRNPNSYRLTGFLRYLSDGKLKDSNQASARIVVK